MVMLRGKMAAVIVGEVLMRFGTALGLAVILGSAASGLALAQTTSPWPSSSPPAQPTQAAPAATPAKPATAARPAAAKPAARKPAARPAAAAAAPAAPALTPEQSGALRFTCSSETKALCQGVAAGSPEAYTCLQGKQDQLSSDCRISVMAVEEANAVEVDPEAPAMPAAPAPRPRQQPRAQQPR
jgi:hypothetical protein